MDGSEAGGADPEELERYIADMRKHVPDLHLTGALSEAMDLIASEYGWDDETILGMTLARIRQVVATISLRAYRERTYKESLLEWQTKALAQMIAATVPIEKKGQTSSPLMDVANSLSLRRTDSSGSDVQRAGRVPRAGSYEAFTRGMGDGEVSDG